MNQKVDKIVIVGGGSAGWMSAATLISQFPHKDITLIESPNISTVGVGESTIGGIRNWCSLIGLDEDDFMQYTDASYKLSIRFTDFYRKGSGSFHYPFGNPYLRGDLSKVEDWGIKKYIRPELPVQDYANTFFPQMALVNTNKIITEDNVLPHFKFKKDSAFHFDATKFAIWLKDRFCIPRGVKHILHDIDLNNIIMDEDGSIKCISLGDKKISADLYVDCTGFKSLLMTQKMQQPFESFSHYLPNNSAWATRVEYDDIEKELTTYTDCHAIENGWVWNIPLFSRIGTGYVYSDKYVSDEDALIEFKRHLRSKGKDPESLEYRKIKMRVGVQKQLWYKNVVCIGLSAGFIEPLESNGLFSVHEFLTKLCMALNDDGRVNQYEKDCFNVACRTDMITFSQFVAQHYALSKRDDTKYWIDNGNRQYDTALTTNEYSLKVSEMMSFVRYKYYEGSMDPSLGICCISVGMNNFPFNRTTVGTKLDWVIGRNNIDAWIKQTNQKFNAQDNEVEGWKLAIKNASSHYEYLKNKFHS